MADARNINEMLEEAINDVNVVLVEEIMDEREENGVDVNRPLDYYEGECSTETPLLFAIQRAGEEHDNSSCEIVDLLLEGGADAEGQAGCDEEQYIPLFAAIKIKNKNTRNRIIKSLLDNGADVNVKGQGGNTPIHRLVVKGLYKNSDFLDTIIILLDKGAKRNIQDDFERTVDILEPDFDKYIDFHRNKRHKLIRFRKQRRENDPRRIKQKIVGLKQELVEVDKEIGNLDIKWRSKSGRQHDVELAKNAPKLYEARIKLERELKELQDKLESGSSKHTGGKRRTRRKARKQRRVKKEKTMKRKVKRTTRRNKKTQSRKTRRQQR